MRRPRLRRLARLSTGLGISLLLVSGLLTDLPPTKIPRAAAAPQPQPAPDPPPPIPPGDREPVADFPPENVLLDPEEIAPEGFNASPILDEKIAGLQPLPKLGGPNFDVYGTGAEDRPHAAIVFPEVVNFEADSGAWRDLPTEFGIDPEGGWGAEVLGVDLHLPRELSSKAPIALTFAEGTLNIAPADASGTGTSDGATITYADALPSTDLVYGLQGGGYQEHIVLRDQDASGTVSYLVATPGFEAVQEPTGEVTFSAGGADVATFAAPLAFDSTDPVARTIPRVSLTKQDVGWRIDVALDPSFLEKATYPVTIDPTLYSKVWATTSGAYDDTYVDSSNPTSSFHNADRIWASNNGPTWLGNGFMHFNIDAFKRDGVVVYNDTEVAGYWTGQAYGTPTIQVHQVTAAWPSPMTWNNQPGVGELIDSHSSPNWTGWWFWDVAPLYQHYIDTRPIYAWPDHGLRYSVPTVNAGAAVYSSDCIPSWCKPYLELFYNNLPGPPTLDVPASGFVSEHDTPTLKVKAGADWPVDPDGESVMVQVQVSDDPNLFTGSHLKWQSGFSDERSFLVPSGVLLDGSPTTGGPSPGTCASSRR